MILRNLGLILLCACLGFGGVSLVEAEPRFVTAQKIEATPTAMDAAEVVCLLAEKSRVRTTCTVDAFMDRIDLRMNVKKKDADKVCTGAVDIISANTRLFHGRGWTLRVLPNNPTHPTHPTKPTRQNADQPLAVCGIR